MKLERALIVIIFIGFNIAYSLKAQEYKHLQLPFNSASPKIDSLFDIVISRTEHKCDYYSLSIIQSGGKFLYSIMELKTKSNAVYLPFMKPKFMKNFAYTT